MEHQEQISLKFDEAARDYDDQRRKLIPCFDDFYGAATAVATPAPDLRTPSILDLGAGTGLLSSLLLRKYPEAKLTLIDLSAKMLENAKNRLREYPNLHYVEGDYTNYIASGAYDLVASALSIHHLSDEDKRKLYRNAYSNLKAGGTFVNADQVQGSSPYLESMYQLDWKSKVEASGLTRQELDSAYERTKLDRMAPLDDQLVWLREAGFVDVDCVYKSYNFVVLFGRKPA